MKIESNTDGKKAIDIIITLDPDEDMIYSETLIPIKIIIKKIEKKEHSITITPSGYLNAQNIILPEFIEKGLKEMSKEKEK